MVLFVSLSVRGAVLFSDSFAYPEGPLVGAAGSPWMAHSSGTAAEVVSNQLQITFSRTEDVSASLAGQPYGSVNGAVLYCAFAATFTALPTSGGAYFAHFKDAGSNFRARLWVSTSGAADGSFRIAIGNTSSTFASSNPLTNDFALNIPYTIVIRYDVAQGTSQAWVDPTEESSPGVTATDTSVPVSITAFAFRQTTGEGTILIDDVRVGTSFEEVLSPVPDAPPAIVQQPQNANVTEGDLATFAVEVTGSAPLTYQWRHNGTNLAAGTSSVLQLVNVTTNMAGAYSVVVSNVFGVQASDPALLIVNPFRPYVPAALSLLNYNVKGNGATNWSVESAQVQAIGRQMAYLAPDVITFQEIPQNYSWEMTNFVNAFLPGYSLAISPGTDGFIRSAIVSRYPITRSQSWLDGADLKPFGYTNTSSANADNFTRDLFEAQIAVPHFLEPLHVFTTHLKATFSDPTEDIAKRAAEGAAISNFLATVFIPGAGHRPYLLAGDLNESNTNQASIQNLISLPTGLRLTNPTNPFTGSSNTHSTATANPGTRLDYILPGGLLYSNINNSQVFRTDRLHPLPATLFSNDCKVASDHLPVLMVFNNPYGPVFRITDMRLTNQWLTLTWQSETNAQYDLERSTTLTNWESFVTDLTASGTNYTFSTNLTDSPKFYRVRRR